MRRLIIGAAAVLALSPFIALASASTPAGAAVSPGGGGAEICVSGAGLSQCLLGGSPVMIGGAGYDFVQGSCSTYQGESYCQVVSQGGQCLSWPDTSGNPVDAVACNGKDRQDWWWSGDRFRNLYATELGSAYSDGVCLNADAADQTDLYYCDVSSSEWAWGS
jgi:hypothetical protein